MAENIPFLVARCRNAQKREGPGFLLKLGRRTGLLPDELALIEPAQASALRRELEHRIREGFKDGAVRRRSGLSLAETAEILDDIRASQPDQRVYAFLLHSEHFPFSVPLRFAPRRVARRARARRRHRQRSDAGSEERCCHG